MIKDPTAVLPIYEDGAYCLLLTAYCLLLTAYCLVGDLGAHWEWRIDTQAFDLHYILLFLSMIIMVGSSINVNVMNYGAVGNGVTYDSQAFAKAWAAACGSRTNSVIYVPAGKKFLVKPMTFQGPCKATTIAMFKESFPISLDHLGMSSTYPPLGSQENIGSLGYGGSSAAVEEVHVHVHHSTFRGTQNGARIKTWQGGKGYARRITFEDITLIDAGNPIIIDQYYCSQQKCRDQLPGLRLQQKPPAPTPMEDFMTPFLDPIVCYDNCFNRNLSQFCRDLYVSYLPPALFMLEWKTFFWEVSGSRVSNLRITVINLLTTSTKELLALGRKTFLVINPYGAFGRGAFDLHYILLFLSMIIMVGSSINVNVMNYGAFGNGVSYDSQAFTKAWAAACGGRTNSVIYVPGGKKFLVKPMIFQGPCKATTIAMQIQGSILAPNKKPDWGTSAPLLSFNSVNGLTLAGTGTIDGQGSMWWKNCAQNPVDSLFRKTRRLHLMNSPSAVVSIDGCTNSIISNIKITNPANSPNTDGIDLGGSTQITILDSLIQTGDDCIAISSGSHYNISGITCGPGHGISIGSLGIDGSSAAVEEVHVRHSTFQGTQNGARIKTWQGGKGYARKITFEQITLVDAGNPIIIDQYYCPNQKCQNQTSAVQISGVGFIGLNGTTSTPDRAIQLSCSRTVPCTNILLEHVHITSKTPTKATCTNSHGRFYDTVPRPNCLLQ
ncbi:probable polygalacturonase At3g15720 [Tripterygium wilfordii]|uniref:probable polygalacturonase At3g15720 n=1 Tax=Tripterygium wilfordii TaxID=458696 RepID=UPI0018F81E72|nr:probable polygalacturonase At3g15720 [Tripterygium wilfordii]